MGKVVSLLLAVCLLVVFSPQVRAGQKDSSPRPNSTLLAVCAVVGMLAVVAVGCWIAHKATKMKPRDMPDDNPPEPPQHTNSQQRLSFTLPALAPVLVAIDGDAHGVAWFDLLASDYVATNQAAFTDPNTGLMYSDLMITTIEGKNSLSQTNWSIVGSRIVWLNPDFHYGSMVICCYDAAGNPSLTNYCRAGESGWTGYLENTNNLPTSFRLLQSEVGTNRFFRLTCKTNEIGILTEK